MKWIGKTESGSWVLIEGPDSPYSETKRVPDSVAQKYAEPAPEPPPEPAPEPPPKRKRGRPRKAKD